jgi:tetratricopeptide (TPR) repeat protein
LPVILKFLSCRLVTATLVATPLLGGALIVAGCNASASGDESAVVMNLNPGVLAQADEPLDLISADTEADVSEPTAAGSYLSALVAANNRDLNSAANYFLMTLEADPNNPELLRQAHIALIMDGRVGEAVPIAKRIEEIEPGDGVALLTLLANDLHIGDLDAAERHLGELPLTGYNTVLVPLVEAWVDVARGDSAAALEAIATGVANDGFEAFRAYHIALIEDLSGHAKEAELAFQVAMQSQEGGSYRVVRAYGAFLRAQGRYDEARAVYDGFQAVNPNSLWLDDVMVDVESAGTDEPKIDTPAEGMAEILFGIASATDTTTSGSTAQLYAQLAGYLSPTSDINHLLIGDLLELDGRSLEAVAAYDKVPPESPLYWSARLREAVNLDRAGQTDEAIAQLQEMAAERPERSDVLVTVGDILRMQERWDDAVVAYDKAVALLGDRAEEDWRMYYVRGIALERSGDWSRAEQDFLTALKIDPESPYVLNYLGYTWVDQGVHLDEALDMIERAVEQRPQDGYIVDSLGWALYRLDDFDGAVRYLERAVELEPGDPVVNDHLGDAYWQVGRRVEAQYQWKRALMLVVDDEELSVPIEAKLTGGLDAGG